MEAILPLVLILVLIIAFFIYVYIVAVRNFNILLKFIPSLILLFIYLKVKSIPTSGWDDIILGIFYTLPTIILFIISTIMAFLVKKDKNGKSKK
jgi:hypothetical protein